MGADGGGVGGPHMSSPKGRCEGKRPMLDYLGLGLDGERGWRGRGKGGICAPRHRLPAAGERDDGGYLRWQVELPVSPRMTRGQERRK